MPSAKNKMKTYLLHHVGEEVTRETLREVAGNIQDWQRSLRQLRQETGLDIVATKTGYVLNSTEPVRDPKIRRLIDNRLKYAVLKRDNSTCQRCGANINNTKDVKLVIDHKIPVELGGENTIENLWTLCSECNSGKQAFFKDDDPEKLKEVMQMKSAAERIKSYFELYPNTVIEPMRLAVIAKVRDWERTLRLVRKKFSMNIKWITPKNEYPMGGYIYHQKAL